MKNIKLMPIVVSLILAMVVCLSGCITINPPKASSPSPTSEPTPAVTSTTSIPTPQATEFDRTFDVPMTGIHMEYFDFRQGDMVVAELVIEGKYDIDLSICYEVETEGGTIINVAGSDVLSLEDIEGYKMFTFVAPVSSRYCFSFRGYYADKPDWKPFAQLSQVAKLHVIANPK